AFDHVSYLTPRTVDALCRLTSGAGVAHREPGQSEPPQIYLKRPILLTVTDAWTAPPDLAARALTVTLPPLDDAARRSEHEIAGVIQAVFPQILGALCTAVSHALASPPPPAPSRTPPRRRPRLGPGRRPCPELHPVANGGSLRYPASTQPLGRCRTRL